MQPHAERGGSDQALLRLVRSLPREEFDVHIALPGKSPLAAEYEAAGATLHEVLMRRISTAHGVGDWVAYVAGWPLAVARLTRLAKRLDADVVHTNAIHSIYGWAVAWLVRRPHVWHAREVVVQSSAALRLERFLCRHFADRVIAVSHAVAAQLDPANVVVLDDPFDPEEFSPRHAGRFRAGAGIPDDAPLVGSVARLDPLKGLDVLLDAFGEITAARPGTRLVIVGAPVQDQERYGAELATRVAATPGARLLESRDDVNEVIADLDVLVLASVEPESYGLVLVEALASGVPVVATDLGGPPEIVARARPGTGLLVAPGDAGALAAAVVSLLPPASAAGARAAREPAISLPPPAFAALFAEVAGTGRRRRR